MTKVEDLLAADCKAKSPTPSDAEPAKVCVAYQTRQSMSWNGETKQMAGRTFEEAFAYQNLAWCQDIKRKPLHLRVVTKKSTSSLADVAQKVHVRVKGSGFDKTDFAGPRPHDDRQGRMERISYIAEGLEWLAQQLTATSVEPVAAVATAKEEPKA